MFEPEAAVNAAMRPLCLIVKLFRRVAVQGDKAEGEGVYTDVHD